MKKILKYIGIIAIVIIVFNLIFNSYFRMRKNDGYVLGDWLINYQDGGFKRRGLSGSFFFLLQDVSGLSLNILVLSFQLIVISLFFYFFTKLLMQKQITLLYLSLLLSPLGFIAYFNCVDYVGKKEFLLFAIFSYFAYQVNSSMLTKRKEYIICVLLFIATLFHEIVFFFVPYFIILLLINCKKINFKSYIKYILAVSIPIFLILLLTIYLWEIE